MSPSPATDPLLRIENVSAHYGEVLAVDNVSIDIQENEFFALLGPSGCGKTTLLRSIAGFETPSSGRIELDGRDLLGLPPHRRPVNLMFQSYALFGHMSVEKNIAYGLEAEGLDRTEVRTRVGEVMETIGLGKWAKRRPAQLSGGQRQRVALARALVKRPRLLLLDEPLSALDRQVRGEMQQELKRLQHEVGLTFVVVTHDQEEAMSMADRVAVLNDGRLEQLDTPVGLYERPDSLFVAGFIGSSNQFVGPATATGIDVPGIGVIAATHRVPAGTAATAIVRPEDVSIHPSAEAGYRATVLDSSYLGGSSTVQVHLDGHERPVHATVAASAPYARNAEVRVRFDAERVIVLASEAPAATAPPAAATVSPR